MNDVVDEIIYQIKCRQDDLLADINELKEHSDEITLSEIETLKLDQIKLIEHLDQIKQEENNERTDD